MEMAKLGQRYENLMEESHVAYCTNTRAGFLAAVEKSKEAATVTDLMGGAYGAFCRTNTEQCQANSYMLLGEVAAAARSALSSLQSARAMGSRTVLVKAMFGCGAVAETAPVEMAAAEIESREQERLSGLPPSYGLDLSQEGRINLPTTPADPNRLRLAYNEAAVIICDTALAAVGGRGSRAAADTLRVPDLYSEAQARGCLGYCLLELDEEKQCGWELVRQALALRRQVLRFAKPGRATLNAQQGLIDELTILEEKLLVYGHGSDRVAEAAACRREALALCETLGAYA